MTISTKRNIHEKSCVNCTHCWYDEPECGPVTDWSHDAWVCDGRKEMVENLRSFPFITKQKCFKLRKGYEK